MSALCSLLTLLLDMDASSRKARGRSARSVHRGALAGEAESEPHVVPSPSLLLLVLSRSSTRTSFNLTGNAKNLCRVQVMQIKRRTGNGLDFTAYGCGRAS